MTRKDNPYFARAAVNRMWAYFFGIGIIDPVDEMVGERHSASHPELLNGWPGSSRPHEFDLKFLIRAITASRAYQLGSAAQEQEPGRSRQFARMPLNRLVRRATVRQRPPRRPATAKPATATTIRSSARKAARPLPDAVRQHQRQADRGADIYPANAVADERPSDRRRRRTWNAARRSRPCSTHPSWICPERVETLYCWPASRRRKSCRAWSSMSRAAGRPADTPAATSADKDKQYNQALADVFWVLLNSGEFFLNH